MNQNRFEPRFQPIFFSVCTCVSIFQENSGCERFRQGGKNASQELEDEGNHQEEDEEKVEVRNSPADRQKTGAEAAG